MPNLAAAVRPTLLVAAAGVAVVALAFILRRVLRHGDEGEDLLPRLDVAEYNDALLP